MSSLDEGWTVVGRAEALPASTASTASNGRTRWRKTERMQPILKPLLRTKMIAFLHVTTTRMKRNVGAGQVYPDKTCIRY